MARTARLSVMIAHEIKAELKSVADGMGMTESALTAYIIGQWLTTQRQVLKGLLGAIGSTEVARYVTQAMAEENSPIVDRSPGGGQGGQLRG